METYVSERKKVKRLRVDETVNLAELRRSIELEIQRTDLEIKGIKELGERMTRFYQITYEQSETFPKIVKNLENNKDLLQGLISIIELRKREGFIPY